ncbi:hypothetical protein GobsT_33230 [Gemmata obscuriglobus]|nr:hypothetical protein GobsT_33230 [Gemmata obscuriglobus]VTS06628.1 unnamed protein product [Gemmata obscuriglobus UQM 2246]
MWSNNELTCTAMMEDVVRPECAGGVLRNCYLGS